MMIESRAEDSRQLAKHLVYLRYNIGPDPQVKLSVPRVGLLIAAPAPKVALHPRSNRASEDW